MSMVIILRWVGVRMHACILCPHNWQTAVETIDTEHFFNGCLTGEKDLIRVRPCIITEIFLSFNCFPLKFATSSSWLSACYQMLNLFYYTLDFTQWFFYFIWTGIWGATFFQKKFFLCLCPNTIYHLYFPNKLMTTKFHESAYIFQILNFIRNSWKT